ncbi:MAG: K+-sensing histidine kinase KdpD [Flavobacteriales bacterium]
METGIVTRIEDNSSYHVCDVISPLDVLIKGQEFPLEDTYCKEFAESLCVIGFPEVGKLDYMNCHPVYQNLKLEAYLSAPIFVDDTLFGTLNFTSTKPRTRGFSKHEHDLIRLMANSIGAYILLRSKEDHLLELNSKMRQFVGYVAHDLRNPIGVIMAIARIGMKPNTSKSQLRKIVSRISAPAEKCLELVSTILDHAALSTGKITLNTESENIHDVLTEAIDSVALFAQDRNINIDMVCDSKTFVTLDKQRISQSLVNLLINAIKYSKDESNVSVSVRTNENKQTVKIANDLPDKDTNNTTDSKLYGSVGFGLDIVNEVLMAHGSKLNIEETKTTYSSNFDLACL